MATCPNGHDSTTDDYCDVCGMLVVDQYPPSAPVDDQHPPMASVAEGYGWVTEIASFLVGGALSPMLAAFTAKLGERLGESIPMAKRRLTLRNGMRGNSAELVVDLRGLTRAASEALTLVEVSETLPQAAWDALNDLDLTASGVCGRQLRWNTDRQAWEPLPGESGPSYRPLTAIVSIQPECFDALKTDPDSAWPAPSIPPGYQPRKIKVEGPQVRVGRHSPTRGGYLEIDLGFPPVDPAISHLHAILQAQPDGSWRLVDPGSANGTFLNDDPEPLAINKAVPVDVGDRILLGAWTVIDLA
ncbi:MAG: FHA domain-containing protein [Trebonia sp.]